VFEYELDSSRGFSMPLFWLQIFGAPFSGMVCGLIVTYVLLLLFSRFIGPNGEIVPGYLAYSLTGFLLGYFTQTLLPRALLSGGRWVWIAPVCILVWGVFNEPGEPPLKTTLEFLAPPAHSDGDGLVWLFATLPAVAACFYSVGIIVAARRTGSSESSQDGTKRKPGTSMIGKSQGETRAFRGQ
jgi:hypothetical protein